jgi:hypothetical protein
VYSLVDVDRYQYRAFQRDTLVLFNAENKVFLVVMNKAHVCFGAKQSIGKHIIKKYMIFDGLVY